MSSRGRGRGRGKGRGRGQAVGRKDKGPPYPEGQDENARPGSLSKQPHQTREPSGHRRQMQSGSQIQQDQSAAVARTTNERKSQHIHKEEKREPSQPVAVGTSKPLPLQTREFPPVQTQSHVGGSKRGSSGVPKEVVPTQAQKAAVPITVPVASAKSEQRGPLNLHGKQQPPDRPGFGRVGKEISLRVNFFPIRLPRDLTLHHYDVTITPSKCPKRINRIVYQELEKKYAASVFRGLKGAFDGSKNVYSSRRLQLQGEAMELQVEVELERKPREFKVTIKKVAQLNIDVANLQKVLCDASQRLTMLQALDVALRHMPSLNTVPVGRSFFSPSRSNPHLLGQGREVWLGHYQSLKPISGWKLVLNVDTAATAFYTEQSVIDFLCAVQKRGRDSLSEVTQQDRDNLIRDFATGRMRDADRLALSKEIKDLKIEVTHLSYPRKWKVNGILKLSARKQTFELDNGTRCTVEEYFKETHKNVTMKYPDIPCLHVGPKTRTIYIPMEFCKIVGGQRCIKKLTDQQTAQMIKSTASPADKRQRDIQHIVSKPSFTHDPVANEFGIEVKSRMMEVPGRVLPPPSLLYNNAVEVKPPEDKGSWEMRNAELYEGVEVKSWAVIVCTERCSKPDVKKFVDGLVRAGQYMGMKMDKTPQVSFLTRRDTIVGVFKRVLSETPNLQLIVAIIDRNPKSQYTEIKRIGDSEMGVATQCVLSDTVQRKCTPPTLANLCLKINGKLGGMNNIIAESSRLPLFKREPVIVFGADVTHPKSGDTISPSIASVVASVDLTASKYMAKHHAQKNRQEIIARLKDMVRELLLEFHRKTRCKPTRIIFYRDGVSEGQFEQVRVEEVSAIQQACLSLNSEYRPPITFLVVQKRHHTRLFPTSDRDAVGKGKNVPPGTTVDREITHPKEFDFYLCSHAAIQGTSRPCHYHILWDDSDFNADDIQKLSYQLCHIFWRCNRSVSYPAPAYYAHHDAARARVLLQALEDQGSSDSGSSVGSQSSDEMVRRANEQLQEKAIQIHENRKDDMYFI